MIRVVLPAMSNRDRRALAAGATCMVLVVVLGRLVPAERSWAARAEIRAAMLSRELSEARMVIGNEKATRDSVVARARVLQRRERDLLHVEGKSNGEAALAAIVSTAAASADIKIDALALDADAGNDGSLQSVAVTGGATGDIQALAAFLTAIERASAHVAVRALSITQSDAASPDTRSENLRLEFTVQAQVISASRASP